MVYAKVLSNKDKLDDVNEILREVFIKEYKYSEDDIFDSTSNHFHVIIYEGIKDGYPLATGRLLIDNNIAKLKWIAVREKYRGMKYGDMVVRMLVEKARIQSCTDIEVDIPTHLIEMFKNIGFLPVENIAENSIRMKYNYLHLNQCQKNQNKVKNYKLRL